MELAGESIIGDAVTFYLPVKKAKQQQQQQKHHPDVLI